MSDRHSWSHRRGSPGGEIGPYCVIGAEVEIGPRHRLMAHVYLEGPTWIGEDNIFSLLHRRGGVAGPEVQGRTRRNPHRGPQTAYASSSPSIAAPRAAASSLRSAATNLLMAYTHVPTTFTSATAPCWRNAVTLAARNWWAIGLSSARPPACTSSARGAARHHRRLQRGHPGRAAVLQHREPARYQGVRCQPRGLGSGADSRPGLVEALQTAFRLLTTARSSITLPGHRSAFARKSRTPEVDELVEFICASERGVIK